MTQFKITIHCAGGNTFAFEEHPTKEDAQAKYMAECHDLDEDFAYLKFGDILINPKAITFIQVQEVIETPVIDPAPLAEVIDIA